MDKVNNVWHILLPGPCNGITTTTTKKGTIIMQSRKKKFNWIITRHFYDNKYYLFFFCSLCNLRLKENSLNNKMKWGIIHVKALSGFDPCIGTHPIEYGLFVEFQIAWGFKSSFLIKPKSIFINNLSSNFKEGKRQGRTGIKRPLWRIKRPLRHFIKKIQKALETLKRPFFRRFV
jgi:hypothetical protein